MMPVFFAVFKISVISYRPIPAHILSIGRTALIDVIKKMPNAVHFRQNDNEFWNETGMGQRCTNSSSPHIHSTFNDGAHPAAATLWTALQCPAQREAEEPHRSYAYPSKVQRGVWEGNLAYVGQKYFG